MMAALKVMPPILWCCPVTSEVDFGVWRHRLNLPTNIPLYVVAMWQMAAEGQSGKIACGMETQMKQRCGMEFLHLKKNCTRWHSLVLAECFWRPNSGCEHSRAVVVRFSSGDSDSRSPLLVQIVLNVVCRLLFIPRENAQLMVETILKKTVFCS